jgi:hypothetical protein
MDIELRPVDEIPSFTVETRNNKSFGIQDPRPDELESRKLLSGHGESQSNVSDLFQDSAYGTASIDVPVRLHRRIMSAQPIEEDGTFVIPEEILPDRYYTPSATQSQLSREGMAAETARLAVSCEETGSWDAALLHYHLLLQQYTDLHGSSSSLALETLIHIANLYRSEKRFKESVRTYRQVIPMLQSHYGRSSSHTLEATHTLVEVLEEDKQLGEAEALCRVLVDSTPDFPMLKEKVVYENKFSMLHESLNIAGLAFTNELHSAIDSLHSCSLMSTEHASSSDSFNFKMSKMNAFRTKVKATLCERINCTDGIYHVRQCTPGIILEVIEIAVWFSKIGSTYSAGSWFSLVLFALCIFGPEYRLVKVYGTLQYGLHCNRTHACEEAIRCLTMIEEELGEIGTIDEDLGKLLLSPCRTGIDSQNFPPAADDLDPGQSLRDLIDRAVRKSRENLSNGYVHNIAQFLPQKGTESSFERWWRDFVSEYPQYRGRSSTNSTGSKSLKYGATFSVSEITGISDSEFMVP